MGTNGLNKVFLLNNLHHSILTFALLSKLGLFSHFWVNDYLEIHCSYKIWKEQTWLDKRGCWKQQRRIVKCRFLSLWTCFYWHWNYNWNSVVVSKHKHWNVNPRFLLILTSYVIQYNYIFEIVMQLIFWELKPTSGTPVNVRTTTKNVLRKMQIFCWRVGEWPLGTTYVIIEIFIQTKFSDDRLFYCKNSEHSEILFILSFCLC